MNMYIQLFFLFVFRIYDWSISDLEVALTVGSIEKSKSEIMQHAELAIPIACGTGHGTEHARYRVHRTDSVMAS